MKFIFYIYALAELDLTGFGKQKVVERHEVAQQQELVLERSRIKCQRQQIGYNLDMTVVM